MAWWIINDPAYPNRPATSSVFNTEAQTQQFINSLVPIRYNPHIPVAPPRMSAGRRNKRIPESESDEEIS